MNLKCAFDNVTVPTVLAGIDEVIANINDGISNCNTLSFLNYNFPKAERKRTLDGENITPYYKPQIYLKSKEWFNLMPDDSVGAFSFFYTNSPKTNFSDDNYSFSQSVNLIVWANLNAIDPTQDSIFKENLIQQFLNVLIENRYFDQIEGVTNIFDGIDQTWTDFDLVDDDSARFIKGNTATFRIEFNVRYTVDSCLC